MWSVHVSTRYTWTALFSSMSPCLVCTYSRNEALEHFKSIQYVKHIIICNTRHENLFCTKSCDIMCVYFDKRFSAGMCSSACGSQFQHVSISGLFSKAADGFHQLASVLCRVRSCVQLREVACWSAICYLCWIELLAAKPNALLNA